MWYSSTYVPLPPPTIVDELIAISTFDEDGCLSNRTIAYVEVSATSCTPIPSKSLFVNAQRKDASTIDINLCSDNICANCGIVYPSKEDVCVSSDSNLGISSFVWNEALTLKLFNALDCSGSLKELEHYVSDMNVCRISNNGYAFVDPVENTAMIELNNNCDETCSSCKNVRTALPRKCFPYSTSNSSPYLGAIWHTYRPTVPPPIPEEIIAMSTFSNMTCDGDRFVFYVEVSKTSCYNIKDRAYIHAERVEEKINFKLCEDDLCENCATDNEILAAEEVCTPALVPGVDIASFIWNEGLTLKLFLSDECKEDYSQLEFYVADKRVCQPSHYDYAYINPVSGTEFIELFNHCNNGCGECDYSKVAPPNECFKYTSSASSYTYLGAMWHIDNYVPPLPPPVIPDDVIALSIYVNEDCSQGRFVVYQEVSETSCSSASNSVFVHAERMSDSTIKIKFCEDKACTVCTEPNGYIAQEDQCVIADSTSFNIGSFVWNEALTLKLFTTSDCINTHVKLEYYVADARVCQDSYNNYAFVEPVDGSPLLDLSNNCDEQCASCEWSKRAAPNVCFHYTASPSSPSPYLGAMWHVANYVPPSPPAVPDDLIALSTFSSNDCSENRVVLYQEVSESSCLDALGTDSVFVSARRIDYETLQLQFCEDNICSKCVDSGPYLAKEKECVAASTGSEIASFIWNEALTLKLYNSEDCADIHRELEFYVADALVCQPSHNGFAFVNPVSGEMLVDLNNNCDDQCENCAPPLSAGLNKCFKYASRSSSSAYHGAMWHSKYDICPPCNCSDGDEVPTTPPSGEGDQSTPTPEPDATPTPEPDTDGDTGGGDGEADIGQDGIPDNQVSITLFEDVNCGRASGFTYEKWELDVNNCFISHMDNVFIHAEQEGAIVRFRMCSSSTCEAESCTGTIALRQGSCFDYGITGKWKSGIWPEAVALTMYTEEDCSGDAMNELHVLDGVTCKQSEVGDGRYSTVAWDGTDFIISNGCNETCTECLGEPTIIAPGVCFAYDSEEGAHYKSAIWSSRPDGSNASSILPNNLFLLGSTLIGLAGLPA
eukprot:GHVL01012217.1.p2 GENE.GHVL01012217.1~~GHVL01012217.1.p2  ORF type:complete len:1059 (+),score=151.28 GHVL01012217.1:3538-6714(+)